MSICTKVPKIWSSGKVATEPKKKKMLYIIQPNMKISSIAISISQSGFVMLLPVEKPKEQVRLRALQLEQVQTLRVQRGWDSMMKISEFGKGWVAYDFIWVVVSNIFFWFSSRKLGKWSNLTSIFFRWVGSNTNGCCGCLTYLVFFGKSEVMVGYTPLPKVQIESFGWLREVTRCQWCQWQKRDGSWCYVFRRDSPLTFEISICEFMARAWECSNKI